MANPKHREILEQGVGVWNEWKLKNPTIRPDLRKVNLQHGYLKGVIFNNTILSGADFSNADLEEARFLSAVLEHANFRAAKLNNANFDHALLISADFRDADLNETLFGFADLSDAKFNFSNLRNADLHNAALFRAKLEGADLTGANLRRAILSKADLKSATLKNVNLFKADLSFANLSDSTITGADLTSSILVNANLSGATLSDCMVFGVSAWDINLHKIKIQKNLRVAPDDEPAVYVDNLEVAQFVYLLLHNEKIRSVIDTIGEKGVLILGRFKPERKAILDAIRDKLRELGFVPMMFDFDPSDKRDFTETIRILAGMSRFIIADISEPKCIPLELQAIVPDYAIPLVPIFHVQQGQKAEEPFAMIRDLQKYDWVFDVLEYETPGILLDSFEEEIVIPAKDMADSLLPQKAEGIRKRRLGEGK